MASFLAELLEKKRALIASGRFRPQRPTAPAPRPIANAFSWPNFSVIAEIKRASPSVGAIADHPVERWATGLVDAGAAMLSVLTEPEHFKGSLETLAAVRAVSTRPLLRKDFLIDERELDEALEWGASAVLLIVAFCGPALEPLYRSARARGLSVLIEVHAERELEAAFRCDAFRDGHTMLGVNQRDLQSLVVDPRFCDRLTLPNGTRFVVESGIRDARDLQWAKDLGAKGVLVGEALAKTADPGATLRSWLGTLR